MGETLYIYTFGSLVYYLLPNDNLFKNIFYFLTLDDLDCVAAVERPIFFYLSIFLYSGDHI